MKTFDSVNNTLCYVPIRLFLRNQEKENSNETNIKIEENTNKKQLEYIDLVTPCIVPPFHQIHSIQLNSPRYLYFSVTNRSSEKQQKLMPNPYKSDFTTTLFVKRKIGFLPYTQDPKGSTDFSISIPVPKKISHVCSSIFKNFFHQQPSSSPSVPSLLGENSSSGTMFKSLFSELTVDPLILSFSSHFCENNFTENFSNPSNLVENDPLEPPSFPSFTAQILHECLQKEKPEMIETYFDLYHLSLLLKRNTLNPLFETLLWDFKIISSFYEYTFPLFNSDTSYDPLLDSFFLNSMRLKLSSFFDFSSKNSTLSLLLDQYFQFLSSSSDYSSFNSLLSAFMIFRELPSLHFLRSFVVPLQNTKFPIFAIKFSRHKLSYTTLQLIHSQLNKK